jgi:hypothetical protein
MMTAKEFTVESWQEASKDLGFKFISPFDLKNGNEMLSYIGWLPDFGSRHGMLIIDDADRENRDRLMKAASTNKFGFSCMTMGYDAYDRCVTIEVLNDWGWTGLPDEAPSWYCPPNGEG